MADYYDTLSATDQAAFRQALFGALSPGACPAVDVSSATSADALSDASTRAVAVDCFQAQTGVGASAGVLDAATYNAVMGRSGGGFGKVLLIGAGIAAAFLLLRGKKGRRRR